MNFPVLLYISPGSYVDNATKCSYGVASAIDQDQLDFLLTTHSLTRAEAIAKAGDKAKRPLKKPLKSLQRKKKPCKPLPQPKTCKSASLSDNAPAIDDNAAPTRAELEQKAKELGIKYDGRWSDKRLASVIAERV